jgi:phosphatidylserine/phosphatidylglycerophosphate/cardiolipin synthase-like enzyme
MKKLLLILFAITFSLLQTTVHSKTDVFFTPDNDIRKMLIELIDDCPNYAKIRIVVYMFTDKKVADALDRAKKRNVDIQVITDSATQKCQYGKIQNLIKSGIETYVYSSQSTSLFPPIMHIKGYYINGKFIGGSFNCTNSASVHNYEMIFLTDENKICSKFLQYCENLTLKCSCIFKNHQVQEESFLQKIQSYYDEFIRCMCCKRRMKRRH